jgi:hypothetical protein
MVRNGCGARVGLPSAARTASTAQHEHPQRKPGAALIVAYALALLRGSGAAFDRLIVRLCPLLGCGRPHDHHVPCGTWKGSVIWPPRCAPHRRYRIEVTSALPALAAQCKRGAA